jgi:hypothetical protein
MFRWVMVGLLCVCSASGGFISFRLGQAAATRDLAPRPPPHAAADAQARASQEPKTAVASGPPDDLAGAREELRLIEAASAAVTRGDFASALPPLIEHERRFHRGWLSRERERLSVKAIDGLLIAQSTTPRRQPRSALSSSRRAFRSRE